MYIRLKLEFKDHLDLSHFAAVSESTTKQELEVECLLCKFKTISLQMHNLHLTTKHKKIDSYRKKAAQEHGRGKKLETHEKIKKRVKKVNKFDFKILKKNKSNPSVAELNGDIYDLVINENSYTAM